MNAISVSIVEFLDDTFPGWVKCEFIDAKGNVCVFEEKVSVVSSENLNAKSKYPCQGSLACEILGEEKLNGEKTFLVNTQKPLGLESTTGTYIFHVKEAQLIRA
jgi:hypothetical protein